MKRNLFFKLLLMCCLMNYSLGNSVAQIRTQAPPRPTGESGPVITTPPTRADDPYVLPVVFHYIRDKYATEGLPDYMFYSLLSQVNANYSLQSDLYIYFLQKSPNNEYLKKGANTNIQFCMAQRDKNNIATTGIIRKTLTSATPLTMVNFVEQYKTISAPWDNYINIYIMQSMDDKDDVVSGGLTFPEQADKKNIVFMDLSNVNVRNIEVMAQVITHESSHLFNLFHVFGDGNPGTPNTDCSKKDGVDDTPDQTTAAVLTPEFGKIQGNPDYELPNGCNNTKTRNYLNFQDYSSGYYECMFTEGQKTRMRNFIASNFASFLNTSGCALGNCAKDAYEGNTDNNDFSKAYVLTDEKSMIQGTLCQNDQDFYRVKTKSGTKIMAFLVNPYKDIYKQNPYNYKLELYKKVNGNYEKAAYDEVKFVETYAILTTSSVNATDEYYVKVLGATANDYHVARQYDLTILPSTGITLDELMDGSCGKKGDKNQTKSTAAWIYADTTINTNLCSGQDVDFYKLSLSGFTNKFVAKLSNIPQGTNYDLIVYNQDGKIISGNPKGSNITETYTLYLSAGTYYLEVKAPEEVANPDVNYKLEVTNELWDLDDVPNVEELCNEDKHEPNDVNGDATLIQGDVLYKGLICTDTDIDTYEVNFSEDTHIQVMLWGDNVKNGLPCDLAIELRDKDNNVVADADYNEGVGSEVLLKEVKKGKYYVKVLSYAGEYNLTDFYRLKVINLDKPCVDKYEPNDDYESAKKIWFTGDKFEAIGARCHQYDDDEFTLYVDESQTYKFELTGENGGDLPGDYAITVYDDDGGDPIILADQSGNEPENATKLLTKGVYHVQVSSYQEAYSAIPYKLTVTKNVNGLWQPQEQDINKKSAAATQLKSFSFYPNPAHTEFTINMEVSGKVSIELRDMYGKAYRQLNKNTYKGDKIKLATGDLRSGLYMLRITLPGGEIKTSQVEVRH